MVTTLVTLTILLAIWTACMRVLRKLKPGTCPSLAKVALRTPLRRKLFGPKRALSVAGLKPGWRVLEVGPGAGFLSVEAAAQLGADGELVCVEIDHDALQRCRQGKLGLNGSARYVVADGLQLPFADNCFDAALMASVLGEVADARRLLREVKRCLKPDASLTINELVLDPDYVFPRTVKSLGADAGLEVVTTSGNLLCHTTKLRKPGAL